MPSDLKKMMWTLLGGVALLVVTNCFVLISDHFTLQNLHADYREFKSDVQPKINELWYARRTAKAGLNQEGRP